MRPRTSRHDLLLIGLVLTITAFFAISFVQTHPSVVSGAILFDGIVPAPILAQPYPGPGSPPIVPTTSPAPTISKEAQKALLHVAEREKSSIQNLVVVNEFRRGAILLERSFQAVTILNRTSSRFYQLLVDRQTGQVQERDVIEHSENQARQTKYGKLQPALYEHLQKMQDDENVTVMIWTVTAPGQSMIEREAMARTTLSAKYPEARAAVERNGKPMDVNDPVLAKRIYEEYVQILEVGIEQQVQPLLNALAGQGYGVYTSKGLPAVITTLTKKVLLQIVQREDVGIIGLAEGGQLRLSLDSATQTNLAPVVWSQGIDGTGVSIAILETDNVDFTSNTIACPPSTNNCFLRPGPTRAAVLGENYHATLVASAAASNHPTYRGMARGATIISAGMTGDTRQHAIDALIWAFDQGAQVINFSAGWCTGSTQMDAIDWAFDHYARYRYKMILASAGNYDWGCLFDHVISPAKGWNVLSVGAYDDRNNANWSDDAMADFSAWRNPVSPNYDHEKPEIVAPGVSIIGIGMNGNLVNDPTLNFGTSFAVPQVSGLAALLIHRNSALYFWPEASRAIIMASATHNIVGPSGIFSGEDLRDGAGGINAALADTIAQTRNTSSTNPCTKSCWWVTGFDGTDFPVGTWRYRYFTANKGDAFRIAIAWWSNPSCPSISNCTFDRLDADLQLGVYDPDSQWVAWSGSWDNNYELVEFVAPKTGTYRIALYNQRFSEDTNYAGIALLRLQPTNLPIILKNSP